MSIVLERIRQEGVIDVFQTVKVLRTQRPAMVQTEVKLVLLFTTFYMDQNMENFSAHATHDLSAFEPIMWWFFCCCHSVLSSAMIW